MMTGIRDAAGVLWPGVPTAGSSISLSQDATGQTIIDAKKPLRVVSAGWSKSGAPVDLTGDIEIPVPILETGTIVGVLVLGQGGPGDVTFGVELCPFASYSGSFADITGGNDVVITAGEALLDVVLTGWTVAVTALDIVNFILKDVDVFTQVHIYLIIQPS